MWLSHDDVLNRWGGILRGFLLEARLTDMVMHVIGRLYRERCPGVQPHVLCCMQSALEIFCSHLLGKRLIILTRRFRNLVLDTWGIVRGGD